MVVSGDVIFNESETSKAQCTSEDLDENPKQDIFRSKMDTE